MMKLTRLISVTALIASITGSFAVNALDASQVATEKPPVANAVSIDEKLTALNGSFRTWYAQHTRQTLDNLPLILVVNNAGITAIKHGNQQKYPVPLDRYNQYKNILHSVLGFYGVLTTAAHAKGNPNINDLETYRSQLNQLIDLIPLSRLPDSQQTEIKGVFTAMLALVDKALADRSISENAIHEVMYEKIRPAMVNLTHSIGSEHAGNLQAALLNVKRESADTDWANVHVVVTGGAAPRRGNLETAVVASVIGKEHLGERIFYAEGVSTLEGALKYLQTMVGDKKLSEYLFNDPTRMWRDLLADTSKDYLSDDFYSELLTDGLHKR